MGLETRETGVGGKLYFRPGRSGELLVVKQRERDPRGAEHLKGARHAED